MRNRKSTIIAGDFNTHLTRTVRRISKDMEELNNIINQQDIMNIIENSTQRHQNVHYLLVSVQQIPKYIISWIINKS